MFAGHIGVALVAGRVEPRVNVGVLAGASLLLDVLLWLFVLIGWESAEIPPDFAATHQPAFVFPYSHGLLAAVGWSVLAGAAALLWSHSRPAPIARRIAALAMTVVFSHWLLDALVHRPELPLAGAASPPVGVGLWDHLPAALAIEVATVGVGMVLYFRTSRLPRARRLGLGAVVVLVTAFTVAGMTVAPAPPSSAAMAASSLAAIALVCALMGWLGRVPHATTP